MPATKTKKPVKKAAPKKFDAKSFKEKKSYPWSKWANGKEHVIVQGKDFDTKIPNMTSAIYGFARRHELAATINQVDPKTLKFTIS